MSTDPQFVHIRIVLGIVLGLALTTLLKGLARFVQHPGRERIYGVHLGWAVSMFVLLTHFWWWEFRLIHVHPWSFLSYAFLLLYVVVLFLLCTLLFPDDLADYQGWRDYFQSRRGWFFAIMAASYLIDFVDTAIKGRAYFAHLGPEYPFRNGTMILLSLAAMRTRSELFHRGFVAGAILYELSWIYRRYDYLQ
ncbi:hypothetical protein [Vulcaniibacterium tengchongense]|uniref:Uncharacterized protein n=1 Tax=Vulcaniibacterium tengchongense TaxID=1273429 RepID=A0A3N4V2M0_9GAMM|nr:hypothetical protein [Vulcaniibacterium tengchongense]RPE77222.1 hypothetical protein EDC50_2487 [Vulcaniibacterium tengchongense]